MTFRWFLFVMTLATVSAWVGWIFVIHSIDPVQSGFIGFALFYLTLTIALLGTSVLLGTVVRLWLRPDEILYRQTLRSFRQGVILCGLFISTLVLLSFDAVRWWTALLLIVLFSLIELLFLSKRSG